MWPGFGFRLSLELHPPACPPRFKQLCGAWLGRQQCLMCDFTSSISYDHKTDHKTDHTSSWAEFQHQPPPRVRAQDLEAME